MAGRWALAVAACRPQQRPDSEGPSASTLAFLDDIEKGLVKQVRFPNPKAKLSQYMSLARTCISYKGFRLEKVDDREIP